MSEQWMSKRLLVRAAMPIISHSFLPILRLSGDAAAIDRGYRDVKSRREIVRWYDSPREKWRQRYRNLVREMEWALLPPPGQLPAEGRQLICKGAFEALFNGKGGGLGMEFEPHLPETSCTVRMWWKPQRG